MGLTAFEALKHSGLIRSPASIEEIEDVLRSPLPYGAGRRRYRFPHQRASRIAAALNFFASEPALPQEPLSLRESLLQLHGIGYKTASWIVRNFTGSDAVAIVDIHLHRGRRHCRLLRP